MSYHPDSCWMRPCGGIVCAQYGPKSCEDYRQTAESCEDKRFIVAVEYTNYDGSTHREIHTITARTTLDAMRQAEALTVRWNQLLPSMVQRTAAQLEPPR